MATPYRQVAGGMLRTEVRIERRTGSIGPGGGWIPGEPAVVVERVRASIEPLGAAAQQREHLVAGGVSTHTSHFVRLRRAAALEVQAADVLVELQDPGRRLEITNRIDEYLAGEIHCLCVEQEVS
jgi:hypothetical protein